jgi:hypothetical protein
MAVSRLARLAAGAPVPVFPAVGASARDAVEDLSLNPGVELVDSPRHATVLLVAGAVPDALVPPLARVHDQMAHPRATLWWSDDAPPTRFAGLDPLTVRAADDPVPAARRLHGVLMTGERPSENDLLPDEPPNAWEGVGSNSQGGEGMMGGTPYGRPMAMTADDRDGLALDPLSFPLGPFLPFLPPGLTLDVVMQGDVLQSVAVRDNPFGFPHTASTGDTGGVAHTGGAATTGVVTGSRSSDPFIRALTEPVPVAELELARARHHLRHLSRVLGLHGLPALGLRTLRLAVNLRPDDGAAVRRLSGRLRRTTTLRWSTEGVGTTRADVTDALSGPNARAAGRPGDVRADDPVYLRLGFASVAHDTGDAWARWRQRLDEAARSLDLARGAGETTATVSGQVESPYGRLDASGPEADAVDVLPSLLEGMEIGDAVATLVSLDIDLAASARRPARSVDA